LSTIYNDLSVKDLLTEDTCINTYKFLDVVYSFVRKANGLPLSSLDNQL